MRRFDKEFQEVQAAFNELKRSSARLRNCLSQDEMCILLSGIQDAELFLILQRAKYEAQVEAIDSSEKRRG